MKFDDLSSPAFYANPYPLYDQLRATAPIVKLAPKIWVTGRYAIIDPLLRDRRMGRAYMAGIRNRYGEEQAQAPVFSAMERMMLLMNPPNHTRLRGLLSKAFLASQDAGFRQLTQTLADGLVDRILQAEHFDVMHDYATPLPLMVICRLLDVPFENSAVFSGAVHDLVQSFELAPMQPAQVEAANAAVASLEKYFKPILRDRRNHPGDDLISCLLRAEEGEDRLSEEEILANIILMFLAGHETTSNMIGNALIALHRHPAPLARALDDASLWPGLAAEALRYDGSVQLSARTALEDIDVGGVHLARGDAVFLFLGAANRDPEKYTDPNQFLIDRPSKDRLLTFGGGIHHCLGARLAMVELEVALGTLFRRVPRMRLTQLDDLRWHQRNALRGVASLAAVCGLL